LGEYRARVLWKRDGGDFRGGRYSRSHSWAFDGGVEIPASASPQVVPAPLSDPKGVDPEEAFVASLASCHMLTFLYLASKAGLDVDAYEDDAVGVLAKNGDGRIAVTVVTLRPRVTFAGAAPDDVRFRDLHHRAHEECFIASSVRTDVRCEPRAIPGPAQDPRAVR
jgi:organic hydroperoxide reductase OsmC/OhrA